MMHLPIEHPLYIDLHIFNKICYNNSAGLYGNRMNSESDSDVASRSPLWKINVYIDYIRDRYRGKETSRNKRKYETSTTISSTNPGGVMNIVCAGTGCREQARRQR